MKVGDIVEWTSQSASTTRTKRGVIVEVVPPHTVPKNPRKSWGMQRDHESYVVNATVIDGSEAQKNRKSRYWPRVMHLRLCDPPRPASWGKPLC